MTSCAMPPEPNRSRCQQGGNGRAANQEENDSGLGEKISGHGGKGAVLVEPGKEQGKGDPGAHQRQVFQKKGVAEVFAVGGGIEGDGGENRHAAKVGKPGALGHGNKKIRKVEMINRQDPVLFAAVRAGQKGQSQQGQGGGDNRRSVVLVDEERGRFGGLIKDIAAYPEILQDPDGGDQG